MSQTGGQAAQASGAILLSAALVTMACCTSTRTIEEPSAVLIPAAPVPDFEADLQRIAREYESWGLMSMHAKWMPTDCAIPSQEGYTTGTSSAPSGSPHGERMYMLYVKDKGLYKLMSDWYRDASGHDAQLDSTVIRTLNSLHRQTLVKETWNELPDRWSKGVPGDLYIMTKYNDETPGTDQGWVYGVVSRSGEVRAIGEIGSCVSCHAHTGRDRLYGQPESWPDEGWGRAAGE